MEIKDILNIIEEFEIRVGENIFSCIGDVIDTTDFLTWLYTYYPKIYRGTEEQFYNVWTVNVEGTFKKDLDKGKSFSLDVILDAMAAYYFQFNDDDSLVAKRIYTIVAKYILDRDTDKIIEQINVEIKEYYTNISTDL